jgi:septal ring factor EnvC (AmiA/AmiB activator)
MNQENIVELEDQLNIRERKAAQIKAVISRARAELVTQQQEVAELKGRISRLERTIKSERAAQRLALVAERERRMAEKHEATKPPKEPETVQELRARLQKERDRLGDDMVCDEFRGQAVPANVELTDEYLSDLLAGVGETWDAWVEKSRRVVIPSH